MIREYSKNGVFDSLHFCFSVSVLVLSALACVLSESETILKINTYEHTDHIFVSRGGAYIVSRAMHTQPYEFTDTPTSICTLMLSFSLQWEISFCFVRSFYWSV